MATTPQTAYEPTQAPRATCRSWLVATCGCTSRAWARTTRITRSRSSCAARAATSRTSTASATSTASRRSSASTPGTAAPSWARPPPAGQGARLLHELELRASRARSSWPTRIAVARARRPEPRVLHLRRLGGGGVRVEAVARLPQAARRHPAHQDHRARDRLPRHHASGALSTTGITPLRTPFEPLVPGALPRAEHEQLPLARGPRPALGGRRRSSSGSSSRAPRPSPR